MASLIPATADIPKPRTHPKAFSWSTCGIGNGNGPPANLALRDKSGGPVLHTEEKEMNAQQKPWRLLQGGEWDSIPFPLEVAVQASPPPREKVENKQRNDYYVNLGSAIRTLREELPVLFSKDLTYDIYRDDITFSDPMNTFHGVENYKLIFRALRFHGRIFFRAIWVDIVRIWQPSDGVILVRWTVKGIPRVPWEAQGRFDGTSKYKLDKEGKIYEHQVDNLAFNFPPKLTTASVLDLVRAAGCPTSPTPTFFGGSGVSVLSNLEGSTWLQFYWAVKNTLDLNDAPLIYGCC
uniref:TSA: Wollemia nobilis Ref_Wollemi_Transcript_4142_1713 transcribed RNA sequence n=1 Tax=Wollemia nobilis TaxID=56998 RepID=A0A0C9RQ12_9CONI